MDFYQRCLWLLVAQRHFDESLHQRLSEWANMQWWISVEADPGKRCAHCCPLRLKESSSVCSQLGFCWTRLGVFVRTLPQDWKESRVLYSNQRSYSRRFHFYIWHPLTVKQYLWNGTMIFFLALFFFNFVGHHYFMGQFLILVRFF